MTEISKWYLHGYVDGDEIPRRIPITSLPFRIGQSDTMAATLAVHHVSEFHAEFYLNGDDLWLRDHDSRNGTLRKSVVVNYSNH
jgi:pSer/pThr/pTyr-binding forkhead associated (FHA) protein